MLTDCVRGTRMFSKMYVMSCFRLALLSIIWEKFTLAPVRPFVSKMHKMRPSVSCGRRLGQSLRAVSHMASLDHEVHLHEVHGSCRHAPVSPHRIGRRCAVLSVGNSSCSHSLRSDGEIRRGRPASHKPDRLRRSLVRRVRGSGSHSRDSSRVLVRPGCHVWYAGRTHSVYEVASL